MKVWVATGAILLVACAALAVLLVDPGILDTVASRQTLSDTVLADRPSGSGQSSAGEVPRKPSGQKGRERARRQRQASSPFALQRAPRHLPVRVEFAPRNEPRAGILFDVDTGRILWQHNAGRRLPIASLTKMMTALIIARRHRGDERVLITRQAVAFEGSGVGVLPRGKRVPLRTLFYGLLLVSGNDAAIALAQHDSGSLPAFVRRMNRWRDRLGLRCSRFSSPSGILDRGNYSCARDLATLARADLADPLIRKVAATREARFPFPIKGNYLDLFNNNPFIINGTEGITGLKTGYTDAAGRCYVTTQKVNGHELGVVLLDTPNPLDQVPALLRAGAKAQRGSDGGAG
jgi:serine-type D-Ala-D-Ala carboxypeptidase (penicillin-binding protein 5/6)